MNYTSTRNHRVSLSSAQAIAKGISPEGGLFVPQRVPLFEEGELRELTGLGYRERAKRILAKYLTDFTAEEIGRCVEGAYAAGKFSSPEVAGLHTLEPGVEILELWRGPTCAFKDMALQLLPRLMTVSAEKTGSADKIAILVATSGDTGKAALEGFRDVPGTCILVFYPVDGVSPMQKLQMTTQEGSNVSACAIKGNFDDAQNGVKAIFTDKAFEQRLAARGISLSSANSINWGRLVPQIVYYVSAYCDMVAKGAGLRWPSAILPFKPGDCQELFGRNPDCSPGRASPDAGWTAFQPGAHVTFDRFLGLFLSRVLVGVGPCLARLAGPRPFPEQQPAQKARLFRRYGVHPDHLVRAIALAIATTDAGVVNEHFAIGPSVNGIGRTISHAMRMLAMAAGRGNVQMRISPARLTIEP